jgi:hypothetical protein
MSQHHADALRTIRREHDDVVAALKQVSGNKNRGAPGVPAFDPTRLEAAIATAGDAYALLLIAATEGFLREYLDGVGVVYGERAGLIELVDRAARELNARSTLFRLRPDERAPMRSLAASRNQYAHGRRTGVFPTVPRVEAAVSRFLHPYPFP